MAQDNREPAQMTKPGPYAKLLVLLALLVAVGVAARNSSLSHYLTREGLLEIQGRIEELRGSLWLPAGFIALYAVSTALALPGSILTIAGGVIFGFWGGTLFNTIGANIGANAAFLLARKLGKEGIDKLAGGRAGRLDETTRQHGFLGLLVLRLVPLVPFNALNFGSGLSGIKWRDYALATGIGILPGTMVYTFFADALIEGSTQAGTAARNRLWLAASLLILLSLIPYIAKRLGFRLPGGSTSGVRP